MQDWLWGPSSLLNGYWGSIPGVERSGREGNHSHPFSVEAKNEWSCTSTPIICFMAGTATTLLLVISIVDQSTCRIISVLMKTCVFFKTKFA